MSISLRFFLIISLLWGCNSSEEIKMRRYLVSGERLYLNHCANCHQEDGRGFKKLYPPLDSIFMIANFAETLCLIKNGGKDTVTIRGVSYSLPMPVTHLTNLELAEVSTYIYHKFAGRESLIGVRDFIKAIDTCQTKNSLH